MPAEWRSTCRCLLVLAIAGCQPRPADDATARPNFLVIAPDTLRADRVVDPIIAAAAAPRMGALAERGVTFTNACTQGAWTVPALASFLTGRYPMGIEARNGELDLFMEGAYSLPEIFGFHGYHTLTFWGASLPGSVPAFSRGFAAVHDTPLDEEPGLDVLDWLRSSPAEPFFALVHDIDLHVAPLGDLGPEGSMVPRSSPGGRVIEEELRALYGQQYDRRVRHYDDGVGRVLDALAASGLAARTVIVLSSNHGEDILEHTLAPDHGLLYESVLRVPLVFYDPTSEHMGRRVDAPARLMDVGPTLLDRAGIPVAADMDGVSLLPLVEGRAGTPPGPLFALSNPMNVAVRDGPHKLILCSGSGCRAAGPAGQQSAREWFEYYDLATDPGERHDRFDQRAVDVLDLTTRLVAWRNERREAAKAARSWTLEAGERAALKERGYWGLVASDGGQ